MINKFRVARKIIKSLQRGATICVSCDAAKISPMTFWRWRKKNPKFDRFICDIFNAQIQSVEDKFYDRLLKGEASEAGYIFFLTNRMPERWRDRRAVINNNNVIQNTIKHGDGNFVGEDREFIEELRERLKKKGIA